MKTTMILLTLALLSAAMLLAGPALAQDQDPQPTPRPVTEVSDDEVNTIAKEVYCPVCESTPLDVCQTKACADWRELIRTKLAEGQTQQEIFDYFSNQYGDRVLSKPPAEGLNLLLWIWPVVAVVAGAFFFVRYLRSLRTGEENTPVAATGNINTAVPKSDDDYISQVEKELQNKK